MKRREFLQLAAAPVVAGAAEGLPNIVLILADDFGYGSLNCYGAEKRHVRTPHLDRLAREGVRFTDANTPSSVCSPTRYAVLTGRYCWRTEAKSGVLNTNAPLHIETTRVTLSSLLKGRGYETAAIGKWHLGYGKEKTDFTKPLTPGPLELGFDYHFGVPQNHGDASGVFVENRGVWGLRSAAVKDYGKNPYGRPFMGIDAPQRVDDEVMDVLTKRAVDWIGGRKKGRPFFLYFTPVAIHEPTTPSARTRGSSGAGGYGDWIHDLDHAVGEVLGALDKGGHSGNTLVIFTSDNGGVLLTEGDRPEAVAYRAGMRVNGGWRGRKHSVYQGGFRVPFLVRWPGKAPAGTVQGEMVNLADLLATVAAVVGEKLPAGGAEDSFNMLPAMLGRRGVVRKTMISHSVEGNFAIREGRWKYIEGRPAVPMERVPAMRKGEMVAQLYDLEGDPGETRNLVETQPEVAARLQGLLEAQRAAGRTR